MLSKNQMGLWETDIDGSKFEFSKWKASESLDTLITIAKMTGKSLGVAIGELFQKGPEGQSRNIEPDAIGEIIGHLTDRIDNKTCMELIKKFSSYQVWMDGKPVNFDQDYQDKFDLLFKVMRAALEVQYGNFFAAFQGMVGIRFPNTVSNRVPQT